MGIPGLVKQYYFGVRGADEIRGEIMKRTTAQGNEKNGPKKVRGKLLFEKSGHWW